MAAKIHPLEQASFPVAIEQVLKSRQALQARTMAIIEYGFRCV